MKSTRIIVSLCLTAALLIGVFCIAEAKAGDVFSPIKARREIENSESGLLQYKSANNEKIAKLNAEVNADEDILVTVTFAKPLNENQFTKIVNDYGLKVHHVLARAVEKDLKRATISLGSQQDMLINKKYLENSLLRNEAKFKGFIEVVTYVPNKNLSNLANDKLVFLVDPSATKQLTENPRNKFMPGLYWSLEDLKMVLE